MSTEDIHLLLQQQLKLMELFAQKFSTVSNDSNNQAASVNFESIANTITEFHYDPAAGSTFEAWFKRYEDIFKVEFGSRDDAWRVRMLLRKLGSAEHERFCNFILPKTPRDCIFEDVVATLKTIFDEQSSLFNIRYQCLNISKADADDFVSYAGRVNRECERFRLGSITNDQFKCLIFASGLRSSRDADIRTRILARIERDDSITLQPHTPISNLS